VTSSVLRRGLVVAGMCSVIAVSSLLGVSVASADDVILSQEYVGVTGLDQLKAQGFDGSGVTIAVIDGNVDTSVPELEGADIEVKAACTSKGAFHGTNMLSILADPIWGWAPKAHFLTYADANAIDPTGYDDPASGCEGAQDDMVQRAINDGADIINISSSLALNDYTLVRAAVRGIPIINAAGNDGEVEQNPFQVSNPRNTIVSVGSTNMSGQRMAYSEYGIGITIMAPADPLLQRIPDDQGSLTIITPRSGGTSSAAPMVTGVLALAMQKWPNANGNQLIASLIATANRVGAGWDEYYGWGTFSPTKLIANDPSQYSTDNPLMDAVPDGRPSRDQYNRYVNGVLDVPISQYDQDYKPKSSTPDPVSPSPTPGPDPVSSGLPGWVVPVGVGGAILVVGLVVILLVARRRTHSSTAPTAQSYPPGSQYSPGQSYPTTTAPPGYQQGYPQAPPSGWTQQPPGGQSQQPPAGWTPPPGSYPPN